MAETKGMSWSEIEKRLDKYAKRACSAAAGKARDDLFKEAQNAIVDFYRHYTPDHYKRHYWNFKKNSFRKYYSNKHSSIFYGGVEFTPWLMSAIYRDPVQEVFDTVYAGFHGVAGMFENPKSFSLIPPRMWPSPMQRLLDKKEEIQANKDIYIAYGKKVAKREVSLSVN